MLPWDWRWVTSHGDKNSSDPIFCGMSQDLFIQGNVNVVDRFVIALAVFSPKQIKKRNLWNMYITKNWKKFKNSWNEILFQYIVVRRKHGCAFTIPTYSTKITYKTLKRLRKIESCIYFIGLIVSSISFFKETSVFDSKASLVLTDTYAIHADVF